jgi:segregation and condensation protein B
MGNETKLEIQIEALLFWKAEPISHKDLEKLLSKSSEEIDAALIVLEKNLEGRGVQLAKKEDEIMLVTASSASSLIEQLAKEELTKDLGKAGLETLTIILYRGPISRREIDYIRGVNSQFIIRNLLVRDLVEKIANPTDQRSFLYRPTFTLLSYLGIKEVAELPEYALVKQEIEAFKQEASKSEEPVSDEPQPPHESHE